MAYASVVQFKQRYDTRILIQLSNDANSPTEVTPTIEAALDDAEAMINSYALQGGAYTTAQLLALAASGDKWLVRMSADLAMCMMLRRRGQGIPDEFTDICDDVKEELTKLQDGSIVLDIAGTETLVDIVELTEAEVSNLDLPSSDEFFGGPVRTPTTTGTNQ